VCGSVTFEGPICDRCFLRIEFSKEDSLFVQDVGQSAHQIPEVVARAELGLQLNNPLS
jgi:hypothetical protein